MSRKPSLGWPGGAGHQRPGPRPQPPQPRAPSPPDPGGDILTSLKSRADKMLAVASHSTSSQPSLSAGQSSLEDLLCRLHAQESIRDTRSSHLNLATNLLKKLSTSPNISLTRLVITLHPGDEGYRLSLHTGPGPEIELARYGYEDTEVLDCVDNQEVPVLIMDLITEALDQETGDLYHGNCVVCEVRDCRTRGVTPKSHLVLLRPTTQSIICDSLSLARPCQTSPAKWSAEDRVNLESQLVLASGSPLCLDPSPVVSLIAGRAEHTRKKFSTLPLRRHAVKRYSQAGHNRKRKLESMAAPPELALHDFIRSKQNQATQPTGGSTSKRKLSAAEIVRSHQEGVQASVRTAEMTNWTQGCLHLASPDTRLAVPAQVDVQKYVRPLPRRTETTDMTPQLDSEYILETAERGQTRIYHTRLTILKRPGNDEYMGELYVERDYREEDKKGSTCRFDLGTLTNATRYINQFTEIFTEEGRKNVKITHKVPNQAPRVSFTPGLRASMTQQQQQQLQQQLAQQGAAASSTSAAAQKKPPLVTTQPQLQVSASAKVVPGASVAVAGGTITVSAAQLGQVALQIQQQGGAKLVPQIVQQRLGQQPAPGLQVVQSGQPGTVQVVTRQQINTAGQVVHKVVQVPQNPGVQPGQPSVSGGQVVTPQPAAGTQIMQTSMGQLTALVPPSIASKLPTAPIARPDLPTSSSTTLQQQQQQLTPQKPKPAENEAISAIVQSLMREGNQFEFEAKKRAEEHRKTGLPSPGVSLAQPQLPTVPVPPASLAAVTAAGRVNIGGLQQPLVTVTSAGVAPGPHFVVTSSTGQISSQLAAQLARSNTSGQGTLPTYSQAVGVGTSLQSVSQLQTSPLRRPSEPASPHLTSPCAGQQPLASPCEGSGSGALSALLADTPAADKPLPLGSASVSSNSLLERLVSGGQGGSSQPPSVNSNLSPAASQLPSVQTGHSNGSGEEITLQSLLSNPAKVQSPSKVSPLLQQLQQPVQSATSPRAYPAGLTSPRGQPPPPASPRAGVTSPRPAPSPRQIATPQSPSARAPTPGSGQISALQQQLMQPPAPRYPVTVSPGHSILSAHLTAPPRNAHTAAALGPAQSQMLVVSNNQPQHQAHSGQVVSVALPDQIAANGSAAASQTVQLVNQQPVQLVSNTGGQVQLVNQPHLQMVNHGHLNNVQLVSNSSPAIPGSSGSVQLVNQQGGLQQVQLVNQVPGGGNGVASVASGGQIMVNNVPMQLSISPHVQFSVALAGDSSQQVSGINTIANGVNTPILVSGAGQPGTVTVTSMASLGKLMGNGPNGAPATVLLQSQTGNILLPPGAGAGVKQATPGAGQLVRQGPVMVRQTAQAGQQSSPVLVQLPSGPQLVRQVSLNPGNINCNLVTAKSGVATPTAPPSLSPSVPSSSSLAAAPGSESPMLVQLNHQSETGAHFLLANTNQKSGLASQPLAGQMMTGSLNQSTLNSKIRQQRKQSLK